MTTWITDDNRNRASIEYWGSEDAAKASLATLKNCSYCSDCSRCSDCSDCSRCSHCSGCSYCSGCSGCSHCSGCSDCSYCSGCSDCSRCSGCSHCSRCSRCSHCSGCSYCSRCSRCSDCSYCSRCSGCSHCSYCSGCSDCSGLAGDEPAAQDAVTVPVIPHIHAAVYAAASQPGALDMGQWHCGTTHCRAGWVVTLAGEAGAALEKRHNTELAAMLIYRESGYRINPARFYDSADDALADMKRLADEEAAAAPQPSTKQ